MSKESEAPRKRGRPRTSLPKIERLPGETDSAYFNRCAEEYRRLAKQRSQEEDKRRKNDDNHKKCVLGGYVLSEIQRLKAEEDPSGPQLARLRDLLRLIEDGVTRGGGGDRSRYFFSELAVYRDLPSSMSADDVRRAEVVGRIFLTAIRVEQKEINDKRELLLLNYIDEFKKLGDDILLGDLLVARVEQGVTFYKGCRQAEGHGCLSLGH